jgi:hypothetical protein
MNPNELFDLLPDGEFYVEYTVNGIRQYDPKQRFPKPKYALYEILSAWYELIGQRRLITNGHMASKRQPI